MPSYTLCDNCNEECIPQRVCIVVGNDEVLWANPYATKRVCDRCAECLRDLDFDAFMHFRQHRRLQMELP